MKKNFLSAFFFPAGKRPHETSHGQKQLPKRKKESETRQSEKQTSGRHSISEATEFQMWFAKCGGMIENKDFEKVLEKF